MLSPICASKRLYRPDLRRYQHRRQHYECAAAFRCARHAEHPRPLSQLRKGADSDRYDGVGAYFYDVNSAKKQEVVAGDGEHLKDLRYTYSDRQSALRVARAEFNRLQRGSTTLSYTLTIGRPDLIPELTYTLEK